MNKLLINEYPMVVLPKLAKEIGLNEAIFLQQLHYWLNGEHAKVRDGRKWIYNTYNDWQEQFPFWSISTIKRIINSLDKQKLLLKGNYNRAGFDKTVWYSIDYEELERLSQSLGQNEPTGKTKMNQPIPETTQRQTITNNIGKPMALAVSSLSELGKVIDKEPATIIQRYAEEYRKVRNRKHPNLKREQVEKIAGVIGDITSEHDLTTRDWETLITSYFAEGSYGDGNMNRFFSGDKHEGVVAGMLDQVG